MGHKLQNVKILNKTIIASILILFGFFNLEAQVVYTFTNCGATGHQGPTQTDVDNEYTGTNLDNQVTSNNGIQMFNAPGGLYRITAKGAGYDDYPEQKGAIMEGEFVLQGSQQLKIVVGQMGTQEGAGSGGSFVTLDDNTPLIIAGGAGGGNTGNPEMMGDIATAGQTTNGGTNGDGGSHTNINGSGGGGLLTDGSGNQGGFAFINGAEGQPGNNGDGGFGGGAGNGTLCRSSGGGGYSGGGGSLDCNSSTSYGGGGGSYNSGTNQNNTPGAHAGHGEVILEYFGNDAGITEINSPSIPSCLDSNVYATVTYFGADPLTSVDITWSLNGVVQDSLHWTGNVPGGGSTQPLFMGTGDFNPGDVIEVWTSMPNGQPDDFNGNDTMTFEVPVFDISNLPSEVILCKDSVVELNTNTDFAKQVWNTGESSRSITINEPGIYSVTTTDVFSGCEAEYEVRVAGERDLIMPQSPIKACDGDTVVIETNLTEGDFFWSNGENASVIQVLTGGTYSVDVVHPSGVCTISDSVEVDFIGRPTANFDGVIGWLTVDFTNQSSNNATQFFWDFGDGGSSTAESPARAYAEGGEYTVMMVASNRCFSDTTYQTFEVDEDNTTSVDELGENSSVNIYPNPSEGVFHIEISELEVSEIQILDMHGKLIRSQRLESAVGKSRTVNTIDLNDVASGIYFVHLKSDKNIETYKLIKK